MTTISEHVDISANGRYIALATLSSASIHNLWSGKVLATLKHQQDGQGLEDQIALVRLDGAGQRLATVGIQTIRIWDVATGSIIGESLTHKGQFWDGRFDATGESFTTAGWEGVRTWNPTTGKVKSRWLIGELPVQAVSVAANPADVAAGAESGFVGLRRRTNQRELEFYGRGYAQIAWIPNSQQLLVTSQDGKGLRRIDLETASNTVLFQNQEIISAVAVERSGRLAAIGGIDKATILDMNESKPIETQLKHLERGRPSSIVRHLSFSPDGRHLATITNDGIVRFWMLSKNGASLLWKSSARYGNG